MKKVLVVLISIAALLLILTSPSFAQSLQGTYVGGGSGSGLLAFCGFNDNGIPNGASNGIYTTLMTNTESRWEFNPDGSGSLQAIIRVIRLANSVFTGSDVISFPWVGESQATAKFTYKLDPKSGKLDITVTESNREWTAGPLKGMTGALQAPLPIGSGIVSQDRQSIKFETSNQPRTLDQTFAGCTTKGQIVEQLSSILLRQQAAPQLVQ